MWRNLLPSWQPDAGRGYPIMGQLVGGVWHDVARVTSNAPFRREPSAFVLASSHLADTPRLERGQLVLVGSKACPWSHYTLMVHSVLGLNAFMPVVELNPVTDAGGWSFKTPLSLGDGSAAERLHQLYTRTAPDLTGRATAPVVYDALHCRIVSNDSEDIGSMLWDWLSIYTVRSVLDLDPAGTRSQTQAAKRTIYEDLSNKVYEIGFGGSQESYDRNIDLLFGSLQRFEEHLASDEFICGSRPTLADLRMLAFLIRFDDVYFIHFKCSRRLIREMPNLSKYISRMLQVPGIASTISRSEIKEHYYKSHTLLNPGGLVPQTGP